MSEIYKKINAVNICRREDRENNEKGISVEIESRKFTYRTAHVLWNKKKRGQKNINNIRKVWAILEILIKNRIIKQQ